ncbi:N-acetyltransferase ESCO2-like [Gigantopelta aegis]|uniref:N-acetyltransferase ESCO2-like n=1 Tax=Gigantopelta aegis TaxID=1735272 RepID=UPI001B88A0CB|nr:N-acetyltransferase ESCO2-like [Gigantopelta aegis]
MATYNTRRKRRWQSSPDEKRKRLPVNEENSPRKRRRTRTGDSPLKMRCDNPLINSDDNSPTFRATSFYGSKQKDVSTTIDKSSRVVTENRPIQNSAPTASSPDSQSSDASGFTRSSKRCLANKPKLSPPIVRSKRVNNQNENKNLKKDGSCNVNKQKRIVTSSYKRLSVVISPLKLTDKKSSAPQDVLITENPKGSLTPAVPGNQKKFFKHRSPASASKSVGSVIVRKGFNLKFMPRRLNTNFWKESSKKDKDKNKQSSKKVNGSSRSVTKPVKVCKNVTNDTSSVVFDITYDFQPLDDTVKKTTESNSTGSKANDENETLVNHSPTSSISLLSEIHPGVTDSLQSCTGSQDLFSTDDRSELSDVCASSSSSTSGKKMFPIFDVNSRVSSPGSSCMSLRVSTRSSPRLQAVMKEKPGMEQMILDAGQKKFGATQCDICGMVYTHADPTDETTHAKFHQGVISALKFPGWKKERVVQEFPNEGSRVIMVLHDDPKYATKKVEEINRIMGQELGFPEQTSAFRPTFKAFLYVSDDKTVDGCCIAEPITEGYRVIPDSEANTQHGGQRPWCCQTEPEPAAVGISRLWVYGLQRHKGIATRLVDCVRQCFEYGVLIDKEKTAFSDPTPDGKTFATKYFGTDAFIVYKYRPLKH